MIIIDKINHKNVIKIIIVCITILFFISVATLSFRYCLRYLQEKSILSEKPSVIMVGKNGDYTSFSEALEYAVREGNIVLKLANKTFDITKEINIKTYGNGLSIGNGVHIIGEANTVIRCNYIGDDAKVQRDFSIFNALPSDFIIENVRIEARNIRYCVHDDYGGTTLPYTHKYINIQMFHDSSVAIWRTPQCIGGGFGINGTIIVDGGIYESVASNHSLSGEIDSKYSQDVSSIPISYHSNLSQIDANNTFVIKNVYCVGEDSVIYYACGTNGTAIITGNSFGRNPVEYVYSGKSYIWNNEIR